MQFRTFYNSNKPTTRNQRPISEKGGCARNRRFLAFRNAFTTAAVIFASLLPFKAQAIDVGRSTGSAISGVNTLRNDDGSVTFAFTGQEGEVVKFTFTKEEFAELVRKKPNKSEFDAYLKAKLDEAEARLAALRKEAEKAQPPREIRSPPQPVPPPQVAPEPMPRPEPPKTPEPAPPTEVAPPPQPPPAAPPERRQEPPPSLREPGEFSFAGNVRDKLLRARDADQVRDALRSYGGGDIADDAISTLSPTERGRLVAMLTPAQQKEYGISSIAGPLLSMPSVFPFKTGGKDGAMGFTIAGVVNLSIPEDVILAKNYKKMLELVRAGLKTALSEEQAQMPADKRMSNSDVDEVVERVMESIDEKTLVSPTNKILKQLKKDDAATKASQRWTIRFEYPPESKTEYSLTVTFAEIRRKSKADITKIFEAKVEEALSSVISDGGERKKAVRKVTRDLSSVVEELHAKAVKLDRELN